MIPEIFLVQICYKCKGELKYVTLLAALHGCKYTEGNPIFKCSKHAVFSPLFEGGRPTDVSGRGWAPPRVGWAGEGGGARIQHLCQILTVLA